MKIFQICSFWLLMVFSVVLAACGGQASPPETAATPIPTTAPLQAVEQAIMAANSGAYEQANQLLDISALAASAEPDSIIEQWDLVTSNQRVANVEISEEETDGEARRLFIRLENDNYPTQQVGFWIRWENDRWVAFDE